MTKTTKKSYTKLMKLPTYKERLKYLSLNGNVGDMTFGGHRYLNQKFYSSKEWRDCRRRVILRDKCCDLACEGREINGQVIVHHMNPVTIEDILLRRKNVLDPENLITVSRRTHELITYGQEENIDYIPSFAERTKNDTCPWR